MSKSDYNLLHGQSLVDLFDTSFRFVRSLFRYNVYLLERNGEDFVLKFAEQEFDDYPLACIRREIKALNRTSEISTIPNLEFVFEHDSYLALLKEYIPGNTLLGLEDSLTDKQKREIKREINICNSKLESVGVYNRDLHSDNIIITSKFKPYIIDLGLVEFDDSDEVLEDFGELVLEGF